LRQLPKKYRDALPLDGEIGRRRSDKNEISDEMFLKKHGFPRRDPTFCNVEMLQYFISGLPRKAIRFFAGKLLVFATNPGLSNSVVTRSKLQDPIQRLTAITVLDQISEIFLDCLSYQKPRDGGHTRDLYFYWFCTMSFIQNVLVGGNILQHLSLVVGNSSMAPLTEKSLQTLLLSRFHMRGGLKAILEIVQQLAVNLPSLDQENGADIEPLLALPANFKKAFSIIRLFTTDSIILDSPQTGLLSNKERHKDQGYYFVVSTFVTETRAACLPVLANLMLLLNKLDKSTAQPLLSTLCDLIVGGQEEYQSDHARHDDGEPSEESLMRVGELGPDRRLPGVAMLANGNRRDLPGQYPLDQGLDAALPADAAPPTSTSARPVGSMWGEIPNIPAGQPEASADLIPIPLPTENESQPMDTTNTDEPETHMDVDEPNQETSFASKDKGKGKEITETAPETLRRLRTEFSANLENYVTDILVYHPDLPFELARLIKAVGKWESSEWIQEKMLELAARLASLEDDKSTKAKEITACAHVLGLLLIEPRYYNAAEAGIVGFLDSFAGFLTVQDGEETPWMAPVLFILEVIVKEAEWRQNRKQHDPKHQKDEVPEIDPAFHSQLLEKLVDVLKSDPTDDNVIICVLRLLARLTREGQYARLFREKNGIQSLLHLNYLHAGKTSIKVSEPTIIIIRHVVEDDKIVLATVRSMIQALLDATANRGRHPDLNELLRNKYAEVLRNPELFGHAVEQLAKLAGYQSNLPANRKLTKKETAKADTAKDGDEKTDESTEIKQTTPETPKKSTLELSHSSGVVQLLLTELLSHSSETISTTKKEEVAPASATSPEMIADSSSSTSAASPSSRPKLTPEENKEYAYCLFLLQTIWELLGSYNNCKLEFVNFSRRGQSREPVTPSKPRSMMLNYLLNDLLPIGVSSAASYGSPQDMNLEKKRGISLVVKNVIASLCKKTPEFYEHDDRPDLLVTVRKFVLEGIARSFKDTLASTGPAALRYSRYTSLADLCRKLLASPVSVPMLPLTYDATTSSEMAKLMFEKGFVGLLTNVIADIELDFPDVRSVINDVLAGLRDLTISVNRLAASSALESGVATGDVDEISTASSVSEEEEEMQERDDTPDVFRNSALGILQGVVDDGHEDHNRHHRFEEYDEDMDYDEDDDDDEDDLNESGSEDDEMDEDGEDMMDVTPRFELVDVIASRCG
jgi:E3 ubiquitin-protein ligase HUWE1